MSSGGRTLVLGAAVGYSAAQVEPFLSSLRRCGYTGDVALFVHPAAARELSRLPLFRGVQLLPAPQWLPLRHPFLQPPRAKRFVWQPLQALAWLAMRLAGHLPLPARLRQALQMRLALLVFPPTEGRFLRYCRFLESRDYARILLSDVRDVLFQSDPFATLPRQGLAVGIESRRYTIATQPWNEYWVRELYGAEVLTAIGQQPVSCSGVTCGDRAAMLEYLRLMSEHIVKLSLRGARHGWFDQAIHNVVLYTAFRGTLHRLDALDSPIATLGGFNDAELRADREGRLLNRDGSIASIVHQYDRLPALGPALLRALLPTPVSSLSA